MVHGSSSFKDELPCQQQLSYIKPAKKPDLPEEYNVPEDLCDIDNTEYSAIKVKDFAWSLSRMALSGVQSNMPTESNYHQKVPTWSAFNSLITDENVPLKIVGFLPILPYPVTSYSQFIQH